MVDLVNFIYYAHCVYFCNFHKCVKSESYLSSFESTSCQVAIVYNYIVSLL